MSLKISKSVPAFKIFLRAFLNLPFQKINLEKIGRKESKAVPACFPSKSAFFFCGRAEALSAVG